MALIYNSLSGQKEKLEKLVSGKKIRLFVCGPTVYDYAHIGNARTYIAFDNIINYLRFRGWKVYYLQNITDIDDKIIRRAVEEKTTTERLAKKFEKIYHQDEKAIGINSVTKYARATRHIKNIVKQIRVLLEKGHAYEIPGDGIYFNIATFPNYGKLARRTTAQAEDSISRIDEGVNKKNKGDFALWKFKKEGAAPIRGEPRQGREPSWNAPFGEGRPGWHIEDTAITEHFFGPQYDIHGGAVDLKFPHHEAEIAQEESASGKSPLVKIWMHAGFLLINGEKMAKSAGNFVTIRDFLKKFPVAVLRYIVASHHYRAPLDYSDAVARQSINALENLSQFVAKLSLPNGAGAGLLEKISFADGKFTEAMDDDFNTPEALAAIFVLINMFQKNIGNISKKEAGALKKFIIKKLQLLGITLFSPKIPLQVRGLAKKRQLLRNNEQFIQADGLRKELEALGYIVEDTPAGPFVWPKSKL